MLSIAPPCPCTPSHYYTHVIKCRYDALDHHDLSWFASLLLTFLSEPCTVWLYSFDLVVPSQTHWLWKQFVFLLTYLCSSLLCSLFFSYFPTVVSLSLFMIQRFLFLFSPWLIIRSVIANVFHFHYLYHCPNL